MRKILGILVLLMAISVSFVFATETPEETNTNQVDNLEVSEELEADEDSEAGEELEFSDELDLDDAFENQDFIDDDVYRMDKEVSLNQDINGNVYVMAQNLKIEEAQINGNLYVLANNIAISNSDIEGSVYMMGQNIEFSSSANDVYAIGSTINFDEDAYVWRNARIAGNHINFDGYIENNLYADAGEFTIGENASIDGILNYSSKEEASIPEQAEIADIQYMPKKEAIQEKNVIAEFIFKIVSVAFRALMIALIVVFCTHKFKTIERTEHIATDFAKDAGKGFLVLIGVPVISILLMVIVIGIGFGLALLALYMVALYIATAVASVEIADRILRKEEKVPKSKIVGLAVLIALVTWLLGLIPFLGKIVEFVVFLIGLGILFSMIFQKNKKEEVNEK